MAQILLVFGHPKETVKAIMMLNKNMKVKVCLPDSDVHNLPRPCTLNVDRSNERNWLYTKNGKKQMT